MLPDPLIVHDIHDGEVIPGFLGPEDAPWLRVLIEEHERFAGRPERDLTERLRSPLPCMSPQKKRLLAAHVLGLMMRRKNATALSPQRVRSVVFGMAAHTAADRETVLAQAAAVLDTTPEKLDEALFADLPGERMLVAPESWPDAGELALRANLLLTQALLARACEVQIQLKGNARAVVRQAQLRGLICAARRPPPDSGMDCVLEISGPFAILRRTMIYGRALAELVPLLAWCDAFRLHAKCILRGRPAVLVLTSRATIFPAEEPRRYDSKLEAAFARDFRRAAPDWDVIREPEPLDAGGVLVFPDFALEHRHDRKNRWLLEIVGFWTPNYIEQKLARLRAANLDRFILCIDEERSCSSEDLPDRAVVVRFRRRVNAAKVREIVEGG